MLSLLSNLFKNSHDCESAVILLKIINNHT